MDTMMRTLSIALLFTGLLACAGDDDKSTDTEPSDETPTDSDSDDISDTESGSDDPTDTESGTDDPTDTDTEETDTEEPTVTTPGEGDLVINELLCDATVDGDPNGDGSSDSVEDEFVELYNASGNTLDLSDVTLVEVDFDYLPRHTFAKGTLLPAGSVIVVFGGGDVSELSADNATFVVADNEDPGFEYGLNLSDDADTLSVVAADGKTTIASVSYGGVSGTDAVLDASLNLSPDITGTSYAAHGDVSGASGDLSPGTLSDGSSFAGPE